MGSQASTHPLTLLVVEIQLSQEEINSLITAYTSSEKAFSSGFSVCGEKFVTIRADERSLYGKKVSISLRLINTSGVLSTHTTGIWSNLFDLCYRVRRVSLLPVPPLAPSSATTARMSRLPTRRPLSRTSLITSTTPGKLENIQG